MVAAAVILGVHAGGLAADEAAREFRRTHRPSRAGWNAMVAARGWRALDPATRMDAQQRLIRTLPTSIDAAGSAWVDRSREWVVVFNDVDAGVAFASWCRDCAVAPTGWETTGSGWDGFDRLDALLEKTPKPALRPRPAPRRAPRDPREIHY